MIFKPRSYAHSLTVKASFELPGDEIPKHQIAHVQTWVFSICVFLLVEDNETDLTQDVLEHTYMIAIVHVFCKLLASV